MYVCVYEIEIFKDEDFRYPVDELCRYDRGEVFSFLTIEKNGVK